MPKTFASPMDRAKLANQLSVLDRLTLLEGKVNRLLTQDVEFNQLSDAADDIGYTQSGNTIFGTGTPEGGDLTGVALMFPGFPVGSNEYNLLGMNLGTFEVGINALTGEIDAGGGNVHIGGSGIWTDSGADFLINQFLSIGLPSDSSNTVLCVLEDTSKACLYIGYQGTMMGGVYSPYLIKYDLQTFGFVSMGTGLNGSVYALALSGSSLYVGGDFTDAGGNATADNLVKLNVSTLAYTTLNGTLTLGVRALAINGNNLYVAGNFASAGGVAKTKGIAVVDVTGPTWSSITSTTQSDGNVKSISLMSGVLYVGGFFTGINSVANTAGLAAYTIGSGLWSSITTTDYHLAATNVINDGTSIYVDGLSVLSGYNVGTATWTSYSAYDSNSIGNSMAYLSTGYVFTGGGTKIAKLKLSDSTWKLIFTFSSYIYSMCVTADNDLFAGGAFAYSGSIKFNGSAIMFNKLSRLLLAISGDVQENFLQNTREQGSFSNGRINASVSSNNLTVKFSPLGYGTNPSAYSPLRIRIVDNFYYVTSTISLTLNSGTDFWGVGGNGPTQFYVYALYNSTDSAVNIAVGLYPWFKTYSDGSGTNTSDLYIVASGSTPAGTDVMELIGSFYATEATTANSYHWSAPTTVETKRPNPFAFTRPSRLYQAPITSDLYGDGASDNGEWTVFTLASVGARTVIASEANHPGIIRIGNNSNANGGCVIAPNAVGIGSLPVNTVLIGGGEVFELEFRIQTTTNLVARIGFSDVLTAAGTVVDGVWISIAGTTLQGNVSSNSSAGSTSTYTVTTGVWYRAVIWVKDNGNANFILFDVNGAVLWNDSLSGGLPIAAGRECAPLALFAKTTAANANIVDCDWITYYNINRLTR